MHLFCGFYQQEEEGYAVWKLFSVGKSKLSFIPGHFINDWEAS